MYNIELTLDRALPGVDETGVDVLLLLCSGFCDLASLVGFGAVRGELFFCSSGSFSVFSKAWKGSSLGKSNGVGSRLSLFAVLVSLGRGGTAGLCRGTAGLGGRL